MSEEKDIPNESGKTEEEDNTIEEFDHTPPPDPRAEMMQQMVANSREEREISRKEAAETLELEEIEEPEEVKEPEEVDKPVEIEDNRIIEREGEKYLRLNVNGVFQEVPVDRAIADLQKSTNADLRVQEAAEAKRKYENLIAQQETFVTPPDAEENAVDAGALKEALEKVYDGDIDDAAEVLSKVLGSRGQVVHSQVPTGVDPNEVARVVKQVQDHERLKDSYNRFLKADEFQHITTDDDLMSKVNKYTEDLQKDSEFLKTNPTYDDYFNEAANRTNDWIERVTGSKVPKSSSKDIDDERLERKRQAKKPPAPRSVRRGPQEESNPFQKSREQIISEMAAKRGQTNYN